MVLLATASVTAGNSSSLIDMVAVLLIGFEFESAPITASDGVFIVAVMVSIASSRLSSTPVTVIVAVD